MDMESLWAGGIWRMVEICVDLHVEVQFWN